jgi:signal transduction histidine kinase
MVNGYPNALRSGVENVLRNAMQHNREGGKVDVRLGAEGSQLVVTIEDQGGGVAEHELDSIFEPFYRAKARQAGETVRGSGLGLAIASRAISLNDGALTARNTEHGLCVEIRLPSAG